MVSWRDRMQEIASDIKLDDFLKRSYEANGVKRARWLNHQIWWFLEEGLKSIWWLRHQIWWFLKEILCVKWLKHQIWWFLEEVVWGKWPRTSNLMISERDVMKQMASKASGGSSIKFGDSLKRSYEANGVKRGRWLKHQIWGEGGLWGGSVFLLLFYCFNCFNSMNLWKTLCFISNSSKHDAKTIGLLQGFIWQRVQNQPCKTLQKPYGLGIVFFKLLLIKQMNFQWCIELKI